MCKYCKRLKELKDFNEKVYKQIISDWRERDKQAREIIVWLKTFPKNDLITVEDLRMFNVMEKFLGSKWIGK